MIDEMIEKNIKSFIKELKSEIKHDIKFEYRYIEDTASYYIYFDNDTFIREYRKITGKLLLKHFYNKDIYNVHLNHEVTNIESNKEIDFEEIFKNAIPVKVKIPDLLNLNHYDNLIKFGTFLFDYRNKKNITKEDLSKILDMPVDDIWQIESAEKDSLGFKRMCDILKTLGYSMDINIYKNIKKDED